MAIHTYDSFTGATIVNVTSHTGEIGATWTNNSAYPTGALTTTGFGKVAQTGNNTMPYASGTPTTEDYAVEADFYLKPTPTVVSINARASTSAVTGYFCRYNTDNTFQIIRYVAGSATVLSTSSAQSVGSYSPHRLRLEVSGTGATVTLTLYFDGTQIATAADTNAARITTKGVAGVHSSTGTSTIAGTHIDNFVVRDLTDTDSIKVFDFANYEVIQRSGTSKNVVVRGIYDGSPTTIQARVVEHGTSTEVVTWTNLSSLTMAQGYFSGTISVPQGGWYNIQVRFSNATGVTSEGANKFGVGVIIGLAGQSNGSNWNLYTDVSINDLVARYPMITGESAYGYQIAKGNGQGGCGNDIVSALNVPVLFLDCAISGSSMTSWLSGTNKNKLMDAIYVSGAIESIFFLQGEFETYAGKSISTITHSGTTATVTTGTAHGRAAGERIIVSGATPSAYNGTFTLATASGSTMTYTMLSDPGADASVVGQYNMGNQAQYKTDLDTLFTSLRSLVNIQTLPIVIMGLNRGSATGYENMQWIRNAQIQKATENYHYFITTTDLPQSSIHFTQAGYTALGKRFAQLIKYLSGNVTYYQGPDVAGYILRSTTVIDVILRHKGGNGLSPASGLTGWRVTDDGSNATISSVARQDLATVRITLSAPISGVVRVYYMDGANPTGTYPVVDDTTLALPPVSTIDGEIPIYTAPSSMIGM